MDRPLMWQFRSKPGVVPIDGAQGPEASRPRVSDFSAARGVADPGGAAASGGSAREALWRSATVSAEVIAQEAARSHGLERASFDVVAGLPPAFRDLSRRYLRDAFAYPFDGPDGPTLAIADPDESGALSAIRLAYGQPVRLVVLSFEEVERLYERAMAEPHDPAEAGVFAPDPDPSFYGSHEDLQDLARGAPIVRLIDGLLERAIAFGATDVHIETERDHLCVRMRIDGHLRRDNRLGLHLAPAVISRIKILAGLDIAERRLPQDGRANLRIGNVEADVRVAIMPTIYGEAAVLRILVKDARLLELSRIGMAASDRSAFEALLGEPHGIIIVTGPTGSGKTTTLATAIESLNDPARKIVTVEDPIEYQIPGIHQTQVKPQIGLTFAVALRSFLRHDPDVIMVGEMRDRETASIGIQAALTGHLVLTTLHTSTASDAIVRLTDMGIEPYLIGASLRGVLGQRLVRRLCERCRKPDRESAQDARKMAGERGLSFPACDGFFVPAGCDACGQTGYRGRIGIFAVLRADAAVHAAIRDAKGSGAISEAARRGGMRSMLEDGLAKCAEGQTSLEEVLRSTG